MVSGLLATMHGARQTSVATWGLVSDPKNTSPCGQEELYLMGFCFDFIRSAWKGQNRKEYGWKPRTISSSSKLLGSQMKYDGCQFST